MTDKDLIRRTEAIEAVMAEGRKVYTSEYANAERIIYEADAVEALAMLPSAEAEQTVIRSRTLMPTKDFKEWAKRIRETNPNAVVIPCDAEVVSAEAVQRWRSGEPTENGEYMVTLDAWGHRYIDIMHYAKPQMPNREIDGACWYRSDDEWGDVVYDDKDIIAWMPLPKPYREDGEA